MSNEETHVKPVPKRGSGLMKFGIGLLIIAAGTQVMLWIAGGNSIVLITLVPASILIALIGFGMRVLQLLENNQGPAIR